MPKEYSARYGRIYQGILAVVLPWLLIVPLILVLTEFKSLEEWKERLIIFVFVGGSLAMSLWLTIHVYPLVTLGIDKNGISLSFDRYYIVTRSDFSVNVSDIKSITRKKIAGDVCYLFETQNPYRKFQISASSRALAYLTSLELAMSELSDLVIKDDESK